MSASPEEIEAITKRMRLGPDDFIERLTAVADHAHQRHQAYEVAEKLCGIRDPRHGRAAYFDGFMTSTLELAKRNLPK